MEFHCVLRLSLGIGFIFLLTLSGGQSEDGSSVVSNSHTPTPADPRLNVVRRKIMRKRMFPGTTSTTSPTDVTVPVTVFKSTEDTTEKSPKEDLIDSLSRPRRPFMGSKLLRPPFGMNRGRLTSPARPFPLVRKSTADLEILETPSSPFKLKLKQRPPLPWIKPTTTEEPPVTTLKSQRKPFPIKKLLKRLKSKVLATTTVTTTVEVPEPTSEQVSEETVEEFMPVVTSPVVLVTTTTTTTPRPTTTTWTTPPPTTTTTTTPPPTTTSTTTPRPTTTTTTTPPPTTTPTTTTPPTTTTTRATTTTTTTTIAPVPEATLPPETVPPSTVPPSTSTSTSNSSMIIIPVPPSQRKPYHPVIMQVTKTPTTAESFPETKIVTYKLNKMFIPMGIYGKVLPKSSSPESDSGVHQQTVVSTPLPFVLSGIDKPKGKSGPEIKVKGHRTKEIERKKEEPMASGDNSGSYSKAVEYAASQKEHHSRQHKQWELMMERLKKKKERNMADGISLTYGYKPNPAQITLTTEKVNVNSISLTSEPPPTLHFPAGQGQDNRRGVQSAWVGHNNNGFNEMGPPRPLNNPLQKPAKTILETISDAASSIPGLIHGGLSTLSGYTQAFEDEAAFPRPTASASGPAAVNMMDLQPAASVIQVQAESPPLPQLDSETLEFFRKRPHLLMHRMKKEQEFSSPEFSSGFKPVTAPPHFASQYYASTPTASHYKGSTATVLVNHTSPTPYEALLRREHLYQESPSSWTAAVTTPPRAAKNFLSDDDIMAYRKAVLNQSKSNYEGPQYTWAGTTPSSPSTKSFAAQWLEFNSKYSKNEIEEARERISSMFSRSPTPTYEDMMYMKPPSPKSGSAFDDLLKMFKMGVSFGAGHTSSDSPMMSYSAGMHKDDTFGPTHTEWVPLSKAGGNKIISFNAGITFGNKPSPTAMNPNTHFSSSSSPYSSVGSHGTLKRPNHYSKGSFYSGSGNSGSSHYSSPIKPNYDFHPPPHASREPSHASHPHPGKPSPTSEFLTNIYYKNKKPAGSYSTNTANAYDISPAISTHFNLDEGRRPWDQMTPDEIRNAITHKRPYSNDPPIEIIPSSQFFREKGNMRDIAAVIKPPEIPDDLVKAALPPHIASVPQLSYPTQQLIQHPNNFKSLSQLQSYFATAQPQPTTAPQSYRRPQSHRAAPTQHQHHYVAPTQHQHHYVAPAQHQHHLVDPPPQPQHHHVDPPPQQQLHHVEPPPQPQHRHVDPPPQPQHRHVDPPPQPQYHHVAPPPQAQHHYVAPSAQPQHHHVLPQQSHYQPAPYQPPPPPPQQSPHQYQTQHSSPHSSQIKVTGDSSLGFSHFELPPGIDPDVASLIKSELEKDDIPEEFRKDFLEAQEKDKKEKAEAAHQQQQQSSRRSDPDIKFHKPIPITPTMLTPVRGKPIRASPVPRYVVELARKLKQDKNVQGIVRVSTKRDKGPPIEYLYPVRG